MKLREIEALPEEIFELQFESYGPYFKNLFDFEVSFAKKMSENYETVAVSNL